MAGGDAQIQERRRRFWLSRIPTSNGGQQAESFDDEITDLEEQNMEVWSSETDLDVTQDHGLLAYSYYYADGEELYEAATTKDADVLANVLVRVSEAQGVSQQEILQSVSPLKDTLLHAAAKSGNKNTLALIASLSHDQRSALTRKNFRGDTALHVAARAGHVAVASELIAIWNSSPRDQENQVATSADFLKQRNKEGNTGLHEALINGHDLLAIDLIDADPEASFQLNREDKSPLYIAAESGYLNCIQHMLLRLGHSVVSVDTVLRMKKKSPILAAVSRDASANKIEVLSFMLREEGRFIQSRDTKGRTAIHYAASIGYLAGVRFLIGKWGACVYQTDSKGFFPIHMASFMGHVDVIEELLQHCRDPGEMLNHKWQNILHVAAKRGRENVVSYILKNPKLQKLVNQRDEDGNTPLHLATMHWHPRVVSILTWDKSVDLNLTNKEGLTALDAALYYMEEMPSFRKRLTWMALRDAGAPRAGALSGKLLHPIPRRTSIYMGQPSLEKYKSRVDTLLLVATLVATVTFAAGFTMPGGFNGSTDSDPGMAVLLRHGMLHVFVFCDTAAMYSSIMVAVVLVWAQLADLLLVSTALQLAAPLLGFGLTMMSVAFTAGTCVVLFKLNWLYITLLVMGLVFLSAVLLLFLPLCPSFPPPSNSLIMRYINFFNFWLFLLVTGSYTTAGVEKED